MPRASSRSSASPCARSVAASSSSSHAAAGSSSMRARAAPQADRDAHELLLGAVVQVALDPASRGVGRLDDARARGPQLGLGAPALA